MKEDAQGLRRAHRLAYALGLLLCLGTPALIAGLILSGVVPPGLERPEGIYQQVGYLFTGLVFLSGAWVWWRRGRVLREFKAQPEAQRPATILRESLMYAAAFELSSLCGLVYWTLVGTQAARHAWGFILLTPVLFLALVPRLGHWMESLDS
ncbi:hypothetical protein GETHLI_25180 [Geothrix limicola]|uniref:Uncharacterized protein n=1 Tax=Geothrix limicola TaxID=2927978 RepID=A0ABQ5QHX3_9BACT|nr:hypothetical protein [Geothrix limicola]GLH74016.1 hypothetical protein GETHLI_25180 [Geothrix limicola]